VVDKSRLEEGSLRCGTSTRATRLEAVLRYRMSSTKSKRAARLTREWLIFDHRALVRRRAQSRSIGPGINSTPHRRRRRETDVDIPVWPNWVLQSDTQVTKACCRTAAHSRHNGSITSSRTSQEGQSLRPRALTAGFIAPWGQP